MTTTSSTEKMAAVRAISPAMAVASSCDWALFMAAAETAIDRVGCCGWAAFPAALSALRLYSDHLAAHEL